MCRVHMSKDAVDPTVARQAVITCVDEMVAFKSSHGDFPCRRSGDAGGKLLAQRFARWATRLRKGELNEVEDRPHMHALDLLVCQ